MKRRKYGRILSMILAVCMLVGTMPADLMGGIASVSAATDSAVSGNDVSVSANEVPTLQVASGGSSENGTYTFDASAIDAIGLADKTKIADGTTFVDGYFKVVGDNTMQYRVNDKGVYCVETGKAETGKLQFTTSNDAVVTIVATCTGGSNTSDVALLDSTGAVVEEANGVKTVTGSGDTAKVTFTYNVEAGTYEVVAPTAENGGTELGRGARIYSVTVEETKPAAVEKTDNIVFNASDVDAIGLTDKTKIADGTTFVDGYFKVVGDNTMQYRVNDKGVYCVETGKAETGKVQFTVKGNAVVKVVATSTGGSNTSDVALLDSTGAVVAEANGVKTVTGSGDSAMVTFTYNVTAGTYELVAPTAENGGTELGRGARIYSISVADTYTESDVQMVERSASYTFSWNDSDELNVIPSTSDGKGPHTSKDGKVTVECGPSNQFKLHGAQYGTQFGKGNAISVKVNGDTTIALAGSKHSANANITVTDADGKTVATVDTTKTTGDLSYTDSKHDYASKDTSNTMLIEYKGAATTLTLTFGSIDEASSSKTYCPWMTLYWMEEAPDWVPLEIPVSIATGADVLGSDSVTITNKDDETDTHKVTADTKTVTLHSESTYVVSTENTKIKATVATKDSFKTGTTAEAVAIDVESLVVNPTVVCADLADGKKLTLTTGEGDAAKTIDLVVGQPVELWIGETYAVACDDETVEARVNDKTSFEATADMTELKIDLLKMVNKVTMTVQGNLGDAKVVMTNTEDANDKVEFGNGDVVELKLNATYNLSCTNEDLFAFIDGKQKYEVATVVSALTVTLDAAEYHTYDVWDFGGDAIESTKYNKYNNLLTVETINGLYPGVAAGTTGVNIASFTLGDMSFDDGGYPTTHRWRSVNGELTRYDGTAGGTDRQKKDAEGNVYRGFIYSNKSNSSDVNLSFQAKAGDIFTFLVGSNGNACTYAWANEAGAADAVTAKYTKAAGVEPLTFYATEDGTYYLWVSDNEKMVVARATRETPNQVTVSGKLTIPAGSDMVGGKLVFTQYAADGTKLADIEAPITSNGSYSVTLPEQYSYSVSLTGKNGYIVDTSKTGDNGEFTLKCSAGNQTVDVTIISVDLVKVTGSLADLTAADAAKLELTFTSDMVYVPEFAVKTGTNEFEAVLEKGVTYTLSAAGVDDYTLDTATIMADADGSQNIKFTKKPVYDITVDMPGVEDASKAELTFERLSDALDGTLDGYVYTFTGITGVQLRDGQYRVSATLEGYTQGVTADLKVNGAAASITINMEAPATEVPYSDTITVGTDKQYATINEALDAVRNMTRDDSQRVNIVIDPGNYEEMLYVDVPNVSLKNAAGENASIELTNKGVDIAENAVRITGYYGHGYSYYSMNDNYAWDADTLAANKANGYESVTNVGSGSATMWNATTRIFADGFQAEGIIFENSFNQYVSKKASEDIIVKQAGAKEGTTTRSALPVGSTEVQNKAYVERAAALAMGNNLSDIVFTNCKIIGRQDTLYGGTNTYVEFNDCAIYGAVDYIFGGMIAIFNKCDLVFNTSEDKNDLGYITAAQQKSGRGYLMYECTVTSTTPGVDTASQYTSKPGYFGRPWQANTSEVVFLNTTVEAADPHWADLGASLIMPAGWNNTLSGESKGMYEYGTKELAGVDNTASRVTWATALGDDLKMNDGIYVTLDAFRKAPSAEGLYNIDLSKGLKEGVVYDGGISVMSDMPMKTDGFVQSSQNPTGDNKGGIPSDGAVLVLNAQADGRLKVDIKSAGDKTFYLVDGNGNCVEDFKVLERTTKVFAVEAGQTYYLYGNGTKICMYSLTVDYRPSVAWDTVADPILYTPVVSKIGDATEGKVTIPFSAQIGGVYSDSMDIKVYKDGVLVDTVNTNVETDPLKKFEGEVVIELPESGDYTFTASLKRLGEKAKDSNTVAVNGFALPMATPVIVNVESQGNGAAKFSWQAVAEAESYNVYLDGKLVANKVKDLFYRFTDLAAGTYEFKVEAVGNGDVSVAAYLKAEVTAAAKKNWLFAAFGDGVDTKNNKYTGSVDDNNLVVHGAGGKGKLVPASTDGLAFYYTTIDPETENFTLTADVTVDEWKYSNGQEGFGMMAADRVGEHGNSATFWNNSYMLSVTKVEYYWDPNLRAVADGGTKYSMKLGVGAQEKTGVTADNLADMISGEALDSFVSRMATLETDAAEAELLAGTYNRAANYTNAGGTGGTDVNPQSTFKMTIQRNNTGYIMSYTDENGMTTSKTYYHDPDAGDALAQLDANNIYVGFFASRNAVISVKNVELTTINPANDAPAEERPIEYVNVNAGFESASIANTSEYELVYYGNADGKITIYNDTTGEVVVEDYEVKAEEKARFNVGLRVGNTRFAGVFTPDPDFAPSKYERLFSYDPVNFSVKVAYNPSDRNIYYVSPDGYGDGSKEAPMEIKKVMNIVKPGDYIIMMEGTYKLDRTLTVQRGIDGTEDNMIYMIADPEATTRPVLDFQKASSGIVLAGNYWYMQGFDVTNSANGQKGVQVSGDNNILDDLHTYRNGNTGIQISRFKGTDTYEDWPSNNLILNCTSYLNADPGYEDADGFAAKLTVADGNVFDGCIAAYNADDGWDLFAKIESGPIGVVTIKNSLAFKNGYDIAADGSEIIAGNGNGFKMGGSSIEGAHVLENSFAFGNRAKGIDSNSGPNIKAYNSTSFDNKSYNVAFYTNTAKNTDYHAEGIISYNKTSTEGDSIKLKGTQDDSLVYGTTNYYEKGTKSTNSAKVQVEDSWFVNLDMNAAINGGITRNANGTINMNGFLELTDAAPANAGAVLDETTGTPSAVITLPELVAPEEDDEEDSSSDADSSDSSDEDSNAGSGSSSNADSDKKNDTNKTDSNKKDETGKTDSNKKDETGKTDSDKKDDKKDETGKTDSDKKDETGKTDSDKKDETGKTDSDKKDETGKTEASTESSSADASAPSVSDSTEGGNNLLPIILGILGVVVVAGIIILVVLKRKDKEDEE